MAGETETSGGHCDFLCGSPFMLGIEAGVVKGFVNSVTLR